ncbi:helix-turn-helix domain-containing protein [Sporolactobacillus inulinus]|uniref:helix-turn-helix domain-containing protein n=1 Tax=Sporolactobacillus inulinus TaxID=2078 RepID=UPI0011415FC1
MIDQTKCSCYNSCIKGFPKQAGEPMIQIKAYTFRLYPNKEQVTFFHQRMGSARFLYTGRKV